MKCRDIKLGIKRHVAIETIFELLVAITIVLCDSIYHPKAKLNLTLLNKKQNKWITSLAQHNKTIMKHSVLGYILMLKICIYISRNYFMPQLELSINLTPRIY